VAKKVKVGTLERRFNVKANKTEGIINYDDDNAYPQRVLYTIASSGIGVSCVNLYSKYIQGQGFADSVFYKAVVNRFGLTNDELLRLCATDYARFKGFAIHVKYNPLLEVNELSWVPFWWCRKSLPDSNMYSSKIVVYDDWDRNKGGYKKDKAKELDLYNPDADVISKQIETAGGYENYKGQIFYFTGNGNEYPTAPCDAVLEDLETDSQIKLYNWRCVKTGFINQSVMTVLGEFADDKEREEYMRGIEGFQGAENSNSILVLEAKTKEDVAVITPLSTNINDKLFQFTKESVVGSVIQCFNQPKILLSIEEAGSLSDASKLNQAKVYYDEVTYSDRLVFEECFTKLFKNWYNADVNPSGNYSIIPVSGLKQESAKQPLAASIGVGGITAIQAILSDPALTSSKKINTLVIVFGVSREDADAMVNGTPLNTDI